MLLLYPVISKSGLKGSGLKGNISSLKSLHFILQSTWVLGSEVLILRKKLYTFSSSIP